MLVGLKGCIKGHFFAQKEAIITRGGSKVGHRGTFLDTKISVVFQRHCGIHNVIWCALLPDRLSCGYYPLHASKWNHVQIWI